MQLISCDSKQCKDWDLQQDDQSLSGFVGKAEFGLEREGCLMGKNHSVRLTLFWVSSAWHKCSSLPGDCCALVPRVIAVLVSQCFGISWHFSKLCFHLCSIAILFICRRMLVFFVYLFYLHNVFKFFSYLGMGIVDIGRVVEKLLCSDARKAPGMGTGFGCPS